MMRLSWKLVLILVLAALALPVGAGAQVGRGISAPPMTYEIDGVQYVAVAAGGNRATDAKQAWDTGEIRAGKSQSVTFDTPGVYIYNCVPHPWMIGRVTVT
jgi:plastocyanin